MPTDAPSETVAQASLSRSPAATRSSTISTRSSTLAPDTASAPSITTTISPRTPPAVRSAIVTGPGAERFIGQLQLPVTVHGPSIDEQTREHRYVLFFSYAQGPAVTAALRGLRASMSAAKDPLVTVRVDPDEVL